MMGERQTDQPALFYSSASSGTCRRSSAALDRPVRGPGDIREHLRPFYSETGRPSIDPELMIRMLIVGYCMGIRSERRLCEEVHLNLAYRWFCRLGLDGAVPDHSTFSKNRHGRFRDSDLLRKLFEMTVARCIAEGLVGGEGFAVDASLIRADVNRQSSVPGDGWEPPEALVMPCASIWMCSTMRRSAVRPRSCRSHRAHRPGLTLDGGNGERAFFAYSTNYLIDLEHAVIVDVEATTSVRQAEVTAARRMIERTQARFGLWPERLAADAGYGDAANLAWLVEEKGIEPHIPVFDKSARRDGTFERSDFTFDQKDDSYICPGGKRLRQRRKCHREPARSSIKTASFAIARASRTAATAPQAALHAQHAGPQDPAINP